MTPPKTPPPNLDMGESIAEHRLSPLTKFMRRVAQLCATPGCYQITLIVDGGLHWMVDGPTKVEGA